MVARVTLPEADGAYFSKASSVETVSSGCFLLDCALGGGIALRRVFNYVGDSQTGKTLLAIEACRNFADKFPDGEIYYNEVEEAFDELYAEGIGLPIKRVKFVKDCETVEGLILDVRKRWAKLPEGKNALYVLDSLDALSQEDEIDRDVSGGTYGMGKAKMLSEFFRTLNKRMSKKGFTLLIISQTRDNIDGGYGNKQTRAGGKALQFYCSQVVWLKHTGRIEVTRKGVKRPIGVTIEADVRKCRIGPPFRRAAFPMIFGFGTDDVVAGIEWLLEVKRHQELFSSIQEAKKAAAESRKMGTEEWLVLRKKLRKVVRRVWKEIEADFAPRRRKYA